MNTQKFSCPNPNCISTEYTRRSSLNRHFKNNAECRLIAENTSSFTRSSSPSAAKYLSDGVEPPANYPVLNDIPTSPAKPQPCLGIVSHKIVPSTECNTKRKAKSPSPKNKSKKRASQPDIGYCPITEPPEEDGWGSESGDGAWGDDNSVGALESVAHSEVLSSNVATSSLGSGRGADAFQHRMSRRSNQAGKSEDDNRDWTQYALPPPNLSSSSSSCESENMTTVDRSNVNELLNNEFSEAEASTEDELEACGGGLSCAPPPNTRSQAALLRGTYSTFLEDKTDSDDDSRAGATFKEGMDNQADDDLFSSSDDTGEMDDENAELSSNAEEAGYTLPEYEGHHHNGDIKNAISDLMSGPGGKVYDIHPPEEHLATLMRDNNCPNRLFGEIMQWADLANKYMKDKEEGNKVKIGHDSSKDFSFSSHKPYLRCIGAMKKKYHAAAGGPPIKCVPFQAHESLPPTYVYKFSLEMHVARILKDPKLMSNFRYRFSANGNKEDGSEERILSEPNTGTAWQQAEEDLLARLPVGANPDDHYLLMFHGFEDGTQVDNIGRLASHPFLGTLMNLNPQARRHPDAWFILGMVPAYPKTSAERKAEKGKVKKQNGYLQFQHKCLRLILAEALAWERNPNGIQFTTHDGRLVSFHLRLGALAGDIVGHDDDTCHYNSHSSNINKMTRDCSIRQSSGDNIHHQCKFTNMEETRSVVRQCSKDINENFHKTDAKARLKAISQSVVKSAFFSFRYGGCKLGVYGICAYETLHLMYLGLLKYLMWAIIAYCIVPRVNATWYKKRCAATSDEALDQLMSTRPKKPKNKPASLLDKAEFERRFRIINGSARRQSDRDMPKSPFKNGVTDLTRLTGQEYSGLCLLTAVAIKGMYEDSLKNDAPDHVKRQAKRTEKRFIRLLFLSLSLCQQLNAESQTMEELDLLSKRIFLYLREYRELVGPIRECHSKSGLRIAKFHALFHFTHYILRYGSAMNFFGGFGEWMLKVLLKSKVGSTSRRQDSLDRDLSNRHFEQRVAERAKAYLSEIGYLPADEEETELAPLVDDGTTVPRRVPSIQYNYMPGPDAYRKKYTAWEGGDYSQWTAGLSVPKFWAVRNESDSAWVMADGSKTKFGPGILFRGESAQSDRNKWVQMLLDYCDDLNRENTDDERKYNKVSFSFSCQETKDGKKGDMYRCNPDFHSYPHKKRPWYDWLIINWEDCPKPARLLLWAKLEDTVGGHQRVVCAVWSLGGDRQDMDPQIMFAEADRLEETPRIRNKKPVPLYRVACAWSIKGVAYVLPAADHRIKAGYEKTFPDDLAEHRYFVSIPQRHDWSHSNLANKLWQEISREEETADVPADNDEQEDGEIGDNNHDNENYDEASSSDSDVGGSRWCKRGEDSEED